MATSTVLLAFGDNTLGGTSRSALISARAWAYCGHHVVVYFAEGVHHSRLGLLPAGTQLVDDLDSVAWDSIDLVHFHHGGWSRSQAEVFDDLSRAVERSGCVIPMLSHNIFGVSDAILNGWPGLRAVGVLGIWAAAQYRCSYFAGGPPFVVPNPQDDDFFRNPTNEERRAAREALLLDERPLILRIGSPIDKKWGDGYARLARSADIAEVDLMLIGAPTGLESQLAQFPNVRFVNSIADDVQLRSLYWAADVFALDSKRGESFGNVIYEALLCGLPVVYRARPFRDNSPWELRNVRGFTYAPNEAVWVRKAIRAAWKGVDRDVSASVDRDWIQSEYSYRAVGEKFRSISDLLERAKSDGRTGVVGRPYPLAPLRGREVICVAMFHNPIIARLRDKRVSRS